MAGIIALTLGLMACVNSVQGEEADPVGEGEESAATVVPNFKLEIVYSGRIGCPDDQTNSAWAPTGTLATTCRDFSEYAAFDAVVSYSYKDAAGNLVPGSTVVPCWASGCSPGFAKGTITRIAIRPYIDAAKTAPANTNGYFNLHAVKVFSVKSGSPDSLREEIAFVKPASAFPTCTNPWADIQPPVACGGMDYLYKSPAGPKKSAVVLNAGGSTSHWFPAGVAANGTCAPNTAATCWWRQSGSAFSNGSPISIVTFRFVAKKRAFYATNLNLAPTVALPGLAITM